MRNAFAIMLQAAWATLLLAGCSNADAPPEDKSAAVESVSGAPDPQSNRHDSNTRQPVGRLTGTIDIQGEFEPLKPLVRRQQAVRDAATCAAQELADESLIVGPGGALKNVFVYLKTKPAGHQAAATDPSELVFDQRGCRFLPRVMLVPTGQALRVLNADPIAHNTRTLPLANPPVNRVNPAGDRQGFTIQYEHPEKIPIQVSCDLHPWMRAYQLVVDHPFAAVTNGEGEFALDNLPVGEHQLRVWQERAGFLERSLKIQIDAQQTTDIRLTYQPDRFDLTLRAKESKS